MVVTQRSKFGIKIYDVWFAKERLDKPGIITYRESVKPIGKNCSEFTTLITDLNASEEKITATFSKNCRYEANRAQREGVEVDIWMPDKVDEPSVHEFCLFFAEFWKSKGYEEVDTDTMCSQLMQYVKEKTLAITRASINGKAIVYHTHILDKDYIRLLHSASLFRMEDEIPRSLVGMANRFLHKEELLYFKKQGFPFYDWGGAGQGEEVKSITEFKKSFGGSETIFYNGEEVQGILPKIAHWYLNRGNK